MNNNFYTVKKEIEGKEYVAQFSGISTVLKAVDECKTADGGVSSEKTAEFIFENVIVEPKGINADDFEDIDEFNKVIKFGQEVMQGKFRDKKEQGTATKASKK